MKQLSWGAILAVAVIVGSVYATTWAVKRAVEPVSAAAFEASEAKSRGIEWPISRAVDDGVRYYYTRTNPENKNEYVDFRVMRGPDGEWALNFQNGDEHKWPRKNDTASR